MNQKRRKEVAKIVKELEDIKTRIEALQEEEQTALDNMPDSLRESSKGDEMQEFIEYFEETTPHIDEAIYCLENIQ